MSPSAKVLSVEALEEFKVTLCKFVDATRDALSSVDMEVNRMIDWLEHEQPAFWRGQIRQRREAVSQARADLQRKKLAGISGGKATLVEEKKALKRAEQRLEEAEQKIDVLKRWARVVRKSAGEYESRARSLDHLIEGEPPGFVHRLEQIIANLDAYVLLAPPPTAATPLGTGTPESMARPVPAAPGSLTTDEQDGESDVQADDSTSNPSGEQH